MDVVFPQLDPAPAYPRIQLDDLFDIANRQEEIPWQPFQRGVDIHRLYGDGKTGPSAALIRFRCAAKISLHIHTGYEHILVLAGTQRDNMSVAIPGTLIV